MMSIFRGKTLILNLNIFCKQKFPATTVKPKMFLQFHLIPSLKYSKTILISRGSNPAVNSAANCNPKIIKLMRFFNQHAINQKRITFDSFKSIKVITTQHMDIQKKNLIKLFIELFIAKTINVKIRHINNSHMNDLSIIVY